MELGVSGVHLHRLFLPISISHKVCEPLILAPCNGPAWSIQARTKGNLTSVACALCCKEKHEIIQIIGWTSDMNSMVYTNSAIHDICLRYAQGGHYVSCYTCTYQSNWFDGTRSIFQLEV